MQMSLKFRVFNWVIGQNFSLERFFYWNNINIHPEE